MSDSYQLQQYRFRINRVMDFIQENLHRPLQLKEVAGVAHFSPYHFHRIFGALVGETLSSFIQRVRVEKAAMLLLADRRRSVTVIALETGFSNSASFARSFKEHFGMSASRWRNGGCQQYRKDCKTESKICKTVSKDGKDSEDLMGYFDITTAGGLSKISINLNARRQYMSVAQNAIVDVREIEPMTVAYIRHIGPYQGNESLFEDLTNKLCTWAGPRKLLAQPDVKFLYIYHDNPDITDDKNLRLSACMTVPKDTEVSGDIGKMDIPGGTCAMIRFELTSEQFGEAWGYAYGEWLPQSGYVPDDRPCYELCLNDPSQHPQHKHIIEICLPVKPM